jgi:hypothetical protein
MREQRMRRAVELGNRDDVAAIIGEVDERKMQRRLRFSSTEVVGLAILE